MQRSVMKRKFQTFDAVGRQNYLRSFAEFVLHDETAGQEAIKRRRTADSDEESSSERSDSGSRESMPSELVTKFDFVEDDEHREDNVEHGDYDDTPGEECSSSQNSADEYSLVNTPSTTDEESVTEDTTGTNDLHIRNTIIDEYSRLSRLLKANGQGSKTIREDDILARQLKPPDTKVVDDEVFMFRMAWLIDEVDTALHALVPRVDFRNQRRQGFEQIPGDGEQSGLPVQKREEEDVESVAQETATSSSDDVQKS